MTSYLGLLQVLLPIFIVIGLGTLLRRLGWLTAEADSSLLKIVVNFLYPCLIFQNVLGNAALREPGNVVLAPIVGFVTMGGGILLAYYAGKALGFSTGHGLRTFAFAVGIFNYGYIPIPLMEALFGRESLGVLLVHNVGCEAAIWTVGLLVLSGLSLKEGWRKLLNPPVFALAIALTLNLSGAAGQMPAMVTRIIGMLAACAIPCGLLLIGATLCEYFSKPRELWSPRESIGSVVLRMGALPVLFLVFAKVLPASPELKHVMVVQAAMPAGILPIVIAKHYGGQPLTAVRVVVWTTVVGLLVIPLWIRFGLAWTS